MKTKMLEQTIFKIGTLLQRGFGELGASIIAESLTQTDYGMDLSLPGKKVEIVYSICRIRQFIDTTETLQDEIIVFVNKIIRIIHLCAQNWDGKPTKNYGERYMITWKLPGYDLVTDFGDGDADKNKADDRNAVNQSQNAASIGENGDDVFLKIQENGQESSFRGKIDERTSLLPDGTRRDKNSSASNG